MNRVTTTAVVGRGAMMMDDEGGRRGGRRWTRRASRRVGVGVWGTTTTPRAVVVVMMLLMLMLMVMVTSATELDDGDAVSASVGAVDGAETVREEEDGRDACAHAANANASASALEEFRYFVLGRTLSEENMCRCFPTWSRGVGEAQAPSQSEVKAKKHHRAPLLSLKAYKADMEEKMAQKREKEAKQREKEEREKEAATASEGAAAVAETPTDGDENVSIARGVVGGVVGGEGSPPPSPRAETADAMDGASSRDEDAVGTSDAPVSDEGDAETSGDDETPSSEVEASDETVGDVDEERGLLENDGYAELVVKPDAYSESDGELYNYASSSNGAKVVAANKDSKHASAALREDKDAYYISPCSSADKFVVVELSEEVTLTSVVLGNFEFHSSSVKDFEIWGTAGHHQIEEGWTRIMRGRADNARNFQKFIAPSPQWVRYVRIAIVGHYENQHFCTMSLLRVHGKDAKETLKEEMERLQAEVEEVESLLSDENEDAEDDGDEGVEMNDVEDVVDSAKKMEDARPKHDIDEEDDEISTKNANATSPRMTKSEDVVVKPIVDDTASEADDAENATRVGNHSGVTTNVTAYANVTSPQNGTSNATTLATAKAKFAPPNDLARGGGDANVFRMLAQKIKDLELNQSLLSRYVESLNTRYGETLEQFGKEIDEIEDGVSNSTEQLDEASRKARESSKACDDAVDRATQTSSKIVKAAIDELDAYRSTVAKRDTVLAIALALTAGALIAARRSSGAIERVLSASASFFLLVIVVANIVLLAQNYWLFAR